MRMRQSLISFCLVLGLTGVATANELDRANTVGQSALAKELPQTVVVRIPKNDPSKVEVLHSDVRLEGNEATIREVAGRQFAKVGINGSQSGVAKVAELDRNSSVSSWRFYYVPSTSYWNSWYTPSYSYYGYNYGYTPYYGYTYDNYYYAYCNYNSSYYPTQYSNGYYYNGYYYNNGYGYRPSYYGSWWY